MPAVQKWRNAFKEIYGRTPTKTDFDAAPKPVKEEYFAEHPPTTYTTEQVAPKQRCAVRLKRPLDESPQKQRSSKVRRLDLDQSARGVRTSPRKSLQSSQKNVKAPLILASGALEIKPAVLREILRTSCQSSPFCKSPVKKAKESAQFSSLFDTPEKGQPAAWLELSPQKAFLSPATPRTPTRSPRKPLVHKEILSKNVECLLLPTPEKKIRVEELTPFEPEELPLKKSSIGLSKKNTAVAFDPKTGKVIKKAFKRLSAVGQKKKKEEKGNFVRINMKKKMFSRGKVSAEQKRKMRRKQNWKRRMVGGRV